MVYFIIYDHFEIFWDSVSKNIKKPIVQLLQVLKNSLTAIGGHDHQFFD